MLLGEVAGAAYASTARLEQVLGDGMARARFKSLPGDQTRTELTPFQVDRGGVNADDLEQAMVTLVHVGKGFECSILKKYGGKLSERESRLGESFNKLLESCEEFSTTDRKWLSERVQSDGELKEELQGMFETYRNAVV